MYSHAPYRFNSVYLYYVFKKVSKVKTFQLKEPTLWSVKIGESACFLFPFFCLVTFFSPFHPFLSPIGRNKTNGKVVKKVAYNWRKKETLVMNKNIILKYIGIMQSLIQFISL